MTVTLPAEWEQFVQERVAAGLSADAILIQALQVLQQKEQHEAKLAALKADIQVGLDQLDAGQGVPGAFNARQMLDDIRRERGQQCGT
jgi:putative addiction module CopG family antidote